METFDTTIEDYGREKMKKKICFANFKRKIQDDEIEPEVIAKRYRTVYPNGDISNNLKWQHPSSECHVLYDCYYQEPRLIVSDKSGAVFVPPYGQQPVAFPYKTEIWTPNSTPLLTPDALKCVFKHLYGWEIMTCRLVCKKWNQVATNTHSLWVMRNIPRIPLFKTKLEPFRSFVRQMFINAKPNALTRFMFKKPALFVYICGLFLGNRSTLRLNIDTGGSRMTVGRFTLMRKTNKLYIDGQTKEFSMQMFFDAYRQSLLL